MWSFLRQVCCGIGWPRKNSETCGFHPEIKENKNEFCADCTKIKSLLKNAGIFCGFVPIENTITRPWKNAVEKWKASLTIHKSFGIISKPQGVSARVHGQKKNLLKLEKSSWQDRLIVLEWASWPRLREFVPCKLNNVRRTITPWTIIMDCLRIVYKTNL